MRVAWLVMSARVARAIDPGARQPRESTAGAARVRLLQTPYDAEWRVDVQRSPARDAAIARGRNTAAQALTRQRALG